MSAVVRSIGCCSRSFIRDWRGLWGRGDFPFIVVQLPNYLAPHDQPTEDYVGGICKAQLAARWRHAEHGGGYDDRYRCGRQRPPRGTSPDVGHRIFLAAQKLAFDRDVVYSGPNPDA